MKMDGHNYLPEVALVTAPDWLYARRMPQKVGILHGRW